MLDSLMKLLVDVFYKYGYWAAGMLSGHGAYELEVPDVLSQSFNRKKSVENPERIA